MKHSRLDRKRSSKRSGFTRVEAVAVFGVAGALGALVLPASAQGTILDLILGRSGMSERSGSCQSNLKQLGLGLLQYQQDYDEESPLATYRGDSYGWANVIQPYIKSPALFQCPAEKHVVAEPEPGSEAAAAMRDSIRKAGFSDYWLNRNASGKNLAAFSVPAQSIAMGDGDGGSPASTARYNIAALPQSWKENKGSPARRHVRSKVEGANYAFLDGHVKWYQHTNISSGNLEQAKGKPSFAIEASSPVESGF